MQKNLQEITSSPITTSPVMPTFDPARHFSRHRLISSIQKKWGPKIKALLIEAQAGQGKSTLALELLAGIKMDSAWCQLGSEHGDPVQFLSSLNQHFKTSLTNFSAPLIEAMLANGEVDASNASDVLARLLQSLRGSLFRDFCLVLDDVYLLSEFPHSQTLLNALLLNAPAQLKLVMISRTPILPQLRSDCPADRVLQVGNADLALSRSEIAVLFNEVLDLPIATGAVKALHQTTEGWIMGMMLVASKSEATGMVINNEALSAILAQGREGIPDYFISEVLSKLPLPLRRTLAKLALLQEIPLTLAEALAEVEDVKSVLRDLHHRNFFVRILDEKQSLYAFHHLFQDCLRRLLKSEFSEAELATVQCEIATW
jgi:ATP/maltotriose-dependent transcriptional regulator MalT